MTSKKRNARDARVREGREGDESWVRKSGLPARVEDAASAVIDAAVEVHRSLGPGLPESCYQLALALELTARQITFQREYVIDITYKDVVVGRTRLDFLVDGCLVVELKSAETISDAHKAQVLTYLKVTDTELGLLINFSCPILLRGTKRIINRHSLPRVPRVPSRPSRSSSKDSQ